jgi:hypothetical protein
MLEEKAGADVVAESRCVWDFWPSADGSLLSGEGYLNCQFRYGDVREVDRYTVTSAADPGAGVRRAVR